MLQILGIVLTIFAIVGLGKASKQWKLMHADAGAVLTQFTLYVALPALLFGSIAETPSLRTFGLGGVCFVGTLTVYLAGLGLGRWLDEPSLAHRAVFSLDATFGNGVFLGTPLVMAVWDTEGLQVLIGMIVWTTLLIPLSVILMELDDRAKDGSISGSLKPVLKNPIALAVVLGVLLRMSGTTLPAPGRLFLDLLGRAASPLALFCLGMSLPAMTTKVLREAILTSALKMLAMPIVVGAVCYISGYTGLALTVAVFIAAMPTGANAFLVARGTTNFGAGSATTVVMTTMLAVVILPMALFVLESR